jgi:hypothetical protein
MFVAAVTIELLNPHDPIFMQAVLKNAGASRLESGCRRFMSQWRMTEPAYCCMRCMSIAAHFNTSRDSAFCRL